MSNRPKEITRRETETEGEGERETERARESERKRGRQRETKGDIKIETQVATHVNLDRHMSTEKQKEERFMWVDGETAADKRYRETVDRQHKHRGRSRDVKRREGRGTWRHTQRHDKAQRYVSTDRGTHYRHRQTRERC